MKYRPTKKQLTHKQANDIFQNCQQGISACQDNIFYWLSKKKSDGLFHIDRTDCFILSADNFNSPNELIKQEQDRILFLSNKMNDMRRFFVPGEQIRKIF